MYVWLEIHKRETFYFQHYFKLFKHFEAKLFSAVSQISRYVPLKEFHEEVANYEYFMIICIAFLAILFFYIVYIYFLLLHLECERVRLGPWTTEEENYYRFFVATYDAFGFRAIVIFG